MKKIVLALGVLLGISEAQAATYRAYETFASCTHIIVTFGSSTDLCTQTMSLALTVDQIGDVTANNFTDWQLTIDTVLSNSRDPMIHDTITLRALPVLSESH